MIVDREIDTFKTYFGGRLDKIIDRIHVKVKERRNIECLLVHGLKHLIINGAIY